MKPSDFSEHEGISNKFEMTHLQQRNQYTPPRTRGTIHPSHSFTMLYCRVLYFICPHVSNLYCYLINLRL